MTDSRDVALRITVSPAVDAGGVDATVLTVRGNLDIDSAAALRASIEQALAASTCRLVLDLSGLAFCDSVGLSALADAHQACARRGGYSRLAGPTPFLLRVLSVVGLLGALAVYESVPAALADDPPGGRPPGPAPSPRQ